MKKILIVMALLLGCQPAMATDFTDTYYIYGGNAEGTQIFQSWPDHLTQLNETFASKENTAFIAGSLADLKIKTTAEPINGEQLITATPSDKDNQVPTHTAMENAIAASGTGIPQVASGYPDDGKLNFNTTDHKIYARTGAEIYSSAAFTLADTLDIVAPTASTFATDATGLSYSFVTSETATIDCTKLTATWSMAGEISNFTGTASPCVSITPVYSGDSGTIAGAEGFLTDTSGNLSAAFSGVNIDNTLNTSTQSSEKVIAANALTTPSSNIELNIDTGGKGQSFLATTTALFKTIRVYVDGYNPGATITCRYDSIDDMTTPLATGTSAIITATGYIDIDMGSTRELTTGNSYTFGCVSNQAGTLLGMDSAAGYIDGSYKYAVSGTGWNLGTSNTDVDLLFEIIGE